MSMKTFKSWRWLPRKKSALSDGGPHGAHGFRMRQLAFMAFVCIAVMFIVYRTTSYQYHQTEIDAERHPFDNTQNSRTLELDNLPKGIVQARSDLELKPLWSHSREKVDDSSSHNLLAIAAGIKQKHNVDSIVQKFLAENFTIMLFHYDGNMNSWWDLDWSNKAIHVAAQNQTKWWFAKRFLHPDIVSIYDYIFLWDEDLGVRHFHPGRYLNIVKAERFEISQPALDPNSTEIHHRITIRKKTKRFHRRIYDYRGFTKCTSSSMGPPCTGWVEGMAPVFSRSAWRCTWHLIQNDLVHGWGLDMKLGYCAQGDRTKRVGIIDSEYVVHQGIQTLGGSSAKKVSKSVDTTKKHSGVDSLVEVMKQKHSNVDSRVEIRRQSTSELKVFKERWERAVKKDSSWVDPYTTNSWFNLFSRTRKTRGKRSW
ncbi:uncharacterized protein LOC110706831 isoform X2 [Chenopodium quinoa]|uniref:uncharacterized protein LOC110706831 isoform X2 n=1 Tax=Chenopodium quinoa TaxID=63459 RepID=UPI000B7716A6|nr:uncharacterized protein LOC110706831 isoform X2 [Chenopodium quinoa]